MKKGDLSIVFGLVFCVVLAAVCLRIPYLHKTWTEDGRTADRTALLIQNAVRDALSIRVEGDRLFLQGESGETVWYIKDGFIQTGHVNDAEGIAPADDFLVQKEGNVLALTVREGAAERTVYTYMAEEDGK